MQASGPLLGALSFEYDKMDASGNVIAAMPCGQNPTTNQDCNPTTSRGVNKACAADNVRLRQCVFSDCPDHLLLLPFSLPTRCERDRPLSLRG